MAVVVSPVMPEDFLNRSQGDILLKGQCRKRVPQHMRCHILGDFGPVGSTFDHFLHLPRSDKPRFMHGKVMLHQGLNAPGHGYNPMFCQFAVRPPLALNP